MNPWKKADRARFQTNVGKSYALISSIRDFRGPGVNRSWSFLRALPPSAGCVNNFKKMLGGVTQNSLRETQNRAERFEEADSRQDAKTQR